MMKRYEQYKDSGVEWLGKIPVHWEIAPLKRMVDIVNGSTPSTSVDDYWDGDIIWVTPVDINSDKYIFSSRRFITTMGLASCGTTLVPQGSVILTTRAPIGKVALAKTDLCTNQGCKSLIARKINNEYLYYFFLCHNEVLESYGAGSTFKELSTQNLANLNITFPTLSEQYNIVCFLDSNTRKIDQLIFEKEVLISKLKEKRQAVINETVTKGLNPNVPMKDSGIEWQGEVPGHWGISTVKRNLSFLNFKRVPLEATERSGRNGEFPYYGASGIIDYIDDYIFDGEYILIGEDGANILNRSTPLAFIAKGKFWVNNHAHILEVPNGNLEYFCHQLELNDFTTLASGSAQPKLTKEVIANLQIVVPPINEQTEIVEYIESRTIKIDQAKAEIETQIGKLKEYKTALISEAVTGKIDVRNWKAPNTI